MNITDKTDERRKYSTPVVINIALDKEISLILQSDPDPDGEPVGALEHFNNDPFKTMLA